MSAVVTTKRKLMENYRGRRYGSVINAVQQAVLIYKKWVNVKVNAITQTR